MRKIAVEAVPPSRASQAILRTLRRSNVIGVAKAAAESAVRIGIGAARSECKVRETRTLQEGRRLAARPRGHGK
jgi:hypothetical protein